MIPAKGQAVDKSTETAESDNDGCPEEAVGKNEIIDMINIQSHAAVGQYIEVCVTQVQTPSDFYFILRKFRADLNNLMDDMQSFYKGYGKYYLMPDHALKPGQICTALFYLSDGTAEWNRAKILEKLDDDNYFLFYIDYGTKWKAKKSMLRFLHKDFASLPGQAIKGHLAHLLPSNGETWPSGACRRFFNLVIHVDLVAGVIDVDYKKRWASLSLTNTNKQPEININDLLVKEKWAMLGDEYLEKTKLSKNGSKLKKNSDEENPPGCSTSFTSQPRPETQNLLPQVQALFNKAISLQSKGNVLPSPAFSPHLNGSSPVSPAVNLESPKLSEFLHGNAGLSGSDFLSLYSQHVCRK